MKLLKMVELCGLFVGIPLLYKFDLIPFHKSIPLLAVFTLAIAILYKDKNFEFNWWKLRTWRYWRVHLLRYLLFVVLTTVAVRVYEPSSLFDFPAHNPNMWLLTILLYPLWSVFPQEVIYRAFFFHRYKELFQKPWALLLMNALLFSFSHIIFNNLLCLVMTFFGSIIFAWTYLKSKSVLAVSIEHALYGNYIFTVGLGKYFFLP
ncbi:CPBP family intramembrane glutamic endopeptidase [Rapidithrix thailandica]|uniref:CPBP family intramembrane glutamic endopeptidase n=1 Tax=Rapidithrix thailandica TaxID=413964 RepID=A0AAW9SI92_9BACT